MATEEKKRSYRSKECLKKGVLNTTGGIALIVLGAAAFGKLLPNGENYSNMRASDYYEETYNTTNPENIKIIQAGENAADLFLNYGLSIAFIGAGIGAGIYGIRKFGEAKEYKYEQEKIDINSEEYKKWSTRQ